MAKSITQNGITFSNVEIPAKNKSSYIHFTHAPNAGKNN